MLLSVLTPSDLRLAACGGASPAPAGAFHKPPDHSLGCVSWSSRRRRKCIRLVLGDLIERPTLVSTQTSGSLDQLN